MGDDCPEEMDTPHTIPSSPTPDGKDVHKACITNTTSSVDSLPSPSSPWLDDYDSDNDRFDPDYGGFRVQSPSANYSHQQHRDLESAFCRNFFCCGLNLHDLHDLLQHYEECHVRFEDDDDNDSLSGEEGSGLDVSRSSHLHVTAPLILGQHHRPRYHRLTAISGSYSGSLLDTMGMGIGIHDTAGSMYDDDDGWSESDSNSTSSSSRSPSLSSVAMGAASPSLAAAIQGGHTGSRSLQLPFLTSPRDSYSAAHAHELAAAGFGPALKRKASVSLSDIYAEDNLDHHFHHHQGHDAAFTNTILRLRSNANNNKFSTLAMPSPMDHLSSVALKKQALENSQRAHAAAAILAQSNLFGSDGNGMPPHAPAPQAQQGSQSGFRSSALHDHPPFPLGHPQHPQTHPLARTQHPLVPSLSHPANEATRVPFGTIPSVLMTSAHRHNMIPGPLQTSLNHAFPPDMTTAEMLRQRDEAFSLIEDMSRNTGACSQGDKPYRCAVLGCDKAYKNPNGLKYHNQHGHCSSLGMCDTDAPGSKPYVCTFLECGKRYKNLNGLKYHIEHSHPNLTAALRAHQSGLMNNLLLYSPYPNQAAMTIAAALAAVQASPMMMAAANAILTAANNNANAANSNNNNGNGAGGNNSGNSTANKHSAENNSISNDPSPTTPTSAAPVTPVSAVPLTSISAPPSGANIRAVCSAPPTATAMSVLPLPLSATVTTTAIPGPLLSPAAPGIPSVLSGTVHTVHMSSSPVSAIPLIQPPPPPRLSRMVSFAASKPTTQKETDEEDMDIDIGGDTVAVESTERRVQRNDTLLDKSESNKDQSQLSLDHKVVVESKKNDITEELKHRHSASSAPLSDTESVMVDDAATPMATMGRKSRGKHTTTTTTQSSSLSSPSLSTMATPSTVVVAGASLVETAATAAAAAAAVAAIAGEKKDRRRMHPMSYHSPEHVAAKDSTVGSSKSGPTMVIPGTKVAAAAIETATATATAQDPLQDEETEDEQDHEGEDHRLRAPTKVTVVLPARSSTSDAKPSATTISTAAAVPTKTMVTRSNRQQQLLHRLAEVKEKDVVQPSPPTTRRSRK
ncbi:hypothetical protein BGZ73_009175 [Actinomortierella ambigua]|nr:hypothetical protein BGZ73_009175 [Actinomortierella ambigua]